MVQDIKLTAGTYGGFDISISEGQIETVDGFDTAIYVSLFTDARAPEAIVAEPSERRGWLGDTSPSVEGRRLGGLLWTIDQSRLTQTTLNKAVDYARKALQWLLDDNLINNIDVTGNIVPPTGISLTIDLQVTKTNQKRYVFNLWEMTGY